MKGKMKRIMALALGVVTCLMSIAPHAAYAADGSDTGPVEMESMNFLRDDFEEYQQTILDNSEENMISFGQWELGNRDTESGSESTDPDGMVHMLQQEILRQSAFDLHSGTTQTVQYVTTTTKCYYGTYYTYYHQMTNRDDATTYIYCVEPKEPHPSNGTYTATRLTSLVVGDTDYLELFKVAMYYGYGGPEYVYLNPDGTIADSGRGLYYSLNSASWEQADGSNWHAPYSIQHLILSYIYNGCSFDGNNFTSVPDDLRAAIETIVNSYKDWMNGNPANRAPENFEAYVFNTNTDTQTIVYGWLRPYGKFSIEKKSSNEAMTSGNSNYSFVGAKYWVYKDATATDTWYETPLVIGADGTSNEIWLEPGTYYLKEDQGNVLKGYQVDSTIYEITITAGTTTHTVVNTSTDVPNYTASSTSKTVYEEPKDDPLRITIHKQDADGNPVSDLGGTTLEGAEYTVYYFEDTSITNANVGSLDLGTAKRKWTFKTIYNAGTGEYVARFDDIHKVSGDALYRDSDDNPIYPIGSYVISETKAPAGYTIAGSTFTEGGTTVTNNRMVVHITDGGAGDTVVSSGNTIIQKEVSIKGGVELTKNDADTYSTTPQGNAVLKGAEYTIVNNTGGTVTVNGTQYANGADIMTLTTDENGHVGTARKVLPGGAYYIYETKTPDGYLINGVHHDFTITTDDQYITIGNATDSVIRGGVKINKRDAELADPNTPQGSASLAGAVYKITNRSSKAVVVNGTSYAPGTVVAKLTTDAQGQAQSAANLLPYGDYDIQEETASNGYKVNSAVIAFSIRENGVIVDLTDKDTTEQVIRGGVKINKRDAELSDPNTPQGNASLAGAVYKITNRSSKAVVVNGTSYAPGTVVAKLTTDAQGQAQTAANLLPYGDYDIQEETPSGGYKLNSTVIPFSIRENGVIVDLTDKDTTEQVIRGGVKINKRDSELTDPDTPQGMATLQGAVYKITNRSVKAVVVNGTSYAPGTVAARITTDAQGHAQAAANLLPYGDYEIQEETPSSGYKLNNTVIAFSIRENGVIVDLTQKDTTEEVIRGGVELVKLDAETLQPKAQADASLEGAKYAIVSENTNPVVVNGVTYSNGETVTTLTTDAHGAAATGKILPRGKYYIYETEPSEGYLLNPNKIHFEITTDGQVFQTEQKATEQVKKQAFQLIKISSNGTNTEVPLVAGAEFTIKLASEVERVGWSTARTYDVLTTDSNGYAKSIELAYGKYLVRETRVPENMSAVQDFYVTITEDSRTPQAWRVFNDTPYEVYLKIVKRDAATGETILLPNVSFKIWDKDNQKYVTQKLGNKKVDTFTTDEDGLAVTPLKILGGHYEVREITAPDGYLMNNEGVDVEIINTNPVQVELDEDGDEVVVVDVYDEAVTGSVSITKHGEVLEEVKRAGILAKIAAFFTGADTENLDFTYQDAPLQGCKFVLVADEDIYTPDHQLDENGNRRIAVYNGVELKESAVAATVTTDAAGAALIEELPLGAYHVEEIATIDGFLRTTTIDSFVLEYAGENVAVVSHDSDWENQRVKTKVTLHKTGTRSGDAVEGAVYGLYNREAIVLSDGTELLPADTLIEKQTTNESGWITFAADLPLEKFYVKEISSPEGFVPDTTEYDVDLSYVDDDTPVIEVRLEVTDDEIVLQVSKQDITTGKELPGAHLQILKEDGSVYEEWTSTDKPHYLEKMPTGKYVLHEDLAPVGYATASDVAFEVKDTGEVQKVVMKDDVTKVEISKQDITTGKELPGAHLQILKEDGSVYAEWDSTDKPHYLEKMPTGKYVLHEDLAPVGYATASDIAFEVKDTGEIQKVVMKDDVTKVEISKQDITTGRELPGAHLQILKEDGSVYAEWDSTDKPHYLEKMPAGKYVLHEVSSPEGYEIASDIAFEVKDTGEIQKVVMYDERTPDVPKTGDNSPLGMIAGVCIAALAAISALLGAIIHRKKTRKGTKSN